MAGDDEKIERLASPGEAAAEENQDTLVTHPNLEGNSNDGKKPADVAAEEKTLFEDKNFAEEGNQTSEKTQISEETQDGKKRQVTAATDYILEAKPSDDDKQVAKGVTAIRQSLQVVTASSPQSATAQAEPEEAVEALRKGLYDVALKDARKAHPDWTQAEVEVDAEVTADRIADAFQKAIDQPLEAFARQNSEDNQQQLPCFQQPCSLGSPKPSEAVGEQDQDQPRHFPHPKLTHNVPDPTGEKLQNNSAVQELLKFNMRVLEALQAYWSKKAKQENISLDEAKLKSTPPLSQIPHHGGVATWDVDKQAIVCKQHRNALCGYCNVNYCRDTLDDSARQLSTEHIEVLLNAFLPDGRPHACIMKVRDPPYCDRNRRARLAEDKPALCYERYTGMDMDFDDPYQTVPNFGELALYEPEIDWMARGKDLVSYQVNQWPQLTPKKGALMPNDLKFDTCQPCGGLRWLVGPPANLSSTQHPSHHALYDKRQGTGRAIHIQVDGAFRPAGYHVPGSSGEPCKLAHAGYGVFFSEGSPLNMSALVNRAMFAPRKIAALLGHPYGYPDDGTTPEVMKIPFSARSTVITAQTAVFAAALAALRRVGDAVMWPHRLEVARNSVLNGGSRQANIQACQVRVVIETDSAELVNTICRYVKDDWDRSVRKVTPEMVRAWKAKEEKSRKAREQRSTSQRSKAAAAEPGENSKDSEMDTTKDTTGKGDGGEKQAAAAMQELSITETSTTSSKRTLRQKAKKAAKKAAAKGLANADDAGGTIAATPAESTSCHEGEIDKDWSKKDGKGFTHDPIRDAEGRICVYGVPTPVTPAMTDGDDDDAVLGPEVVFKAVKSGAVPPNNAPALAIMRELGCLASIGVHVHWWLVHSRFVTGADKLARAAVDAMEAVEEKRVEDEQDV